VISDDNAGSNLSFHGHCMELSIMYNRDVAGVGIVPNAIPAYAAVDKVVYGHMKGTLTSSIIRRIKGHELDLEENDSSRTKSKDV
jgi:hypothetical protein